MKQLYFSLISLLVSFSALAQVQLTPLAKTMASDASMQSSLDSRTNFTKSGAAPLWGAGSAVGSTDGEFANAFVQAGTFSAGDNPTQWTALSVSQSGGAVTPGSAYWERSLLGYSQGAYWGGTTPAGSNSPTNGVAIFDSDFLDNNGNAGAFGTGTSPSPHRGELISPRIDLTGQTNAGIAVNFFSWFREFNISELSVGISTDDGATWTTTDYRSLTGNQVQEFVEVTFPSVTAGVTNLSQCRIKFVFGGDYYFAIVDDVSVNVAIDYDLTFGPYGPNAGVSGLAYGDQIHITGNRYFPISQIGQDERHISFGANVVNRGVTDVLVADAPTLTLDVEYDDPALGWVSVYTESIAATQDIPAGGGISIVENTLNDTSWMIVGDYRATYTASFSGTDGNPGNNTIQHEFSITPNDYASKVGIGTFGEPLSTRSIFPGGGPHSAWEYGSVFYFDGATNSGLNLDEVTFGYRLTNSFTGPASQLLLVNIYSAQDTNADGNVQESELTLIGQGQASLTGLGTTIAPGSFSAATVIGFSDPTTGVPLGSLPLTDGHYYVAIETNPAITGGSATFDINDVPWLTANEVKDYDMNYGLSSANSLIYPSPVSVTDPFGTRSFNSVGFGASVVPSIALRLSTSQNTTTADGSFTDASIWQNGTVPTLSETATIDHHVTLDSDLTVDGSITINSARSMEVSPGTVLTLNGSIVNNGNLVFKNDNTGVGQLLVGAAASLTGEATVERYIPALSNSRRAYRFVTSAVNSSGTIYENWQENGATPAGYGTHISGSTTGANGFDITGSGEPSMYTYDHLNNSWASVTNTDTDQLVAGQAYLLFIRGDRNYDMTSSPVDPVNSNVTLRATGSLNLNDIAYQGLQVGGVDAGEISRNANEFSFLGNPYQAVVDFESLAKSNVNPNFMYIWNANLGVHGAYETIDVSGAVDTRQFIQPGQAFFVVTLADGDASVTFTENDKAPANAANTVFSEDYTTSIEISLSGKNQNDETLEFDALKVVFDDENAINSKDAPKLLNHAENLSIKKTDRLFSIEHRALPAADEIIELDLSGLTLADYKFEVSAGNLPAGMQAYILDQYDGKYYRVDEGSTLIDFSVDLSNPQSASADRFQIVFEKSDIDVSTQLTTTLYPNPLSDGMLHLQLPEMAEIKADISIVNLLGQEVYRGETALDTLGTAVLDLENLKGGAYILTIDDGKQTVSHKLIVK